MIWQLGSLWSDAPVAFWLVLAACAYLLVLAVRLAVIDVRSHLLPNRLVLPAYGVAGVLLLSAAWASADAGGAVRIVAGATLLWVFYFLIRLAHPPGMGFGDVKLAGVLGLYLGYTGWTSLLYATLLGFLLGGVWGVLIVVSRRGNLKTAIPFGPFMLAGAVLTLALA